MSDGNELGGRPQSRVGTVLRGKYRIDRVLGVGGMATVYAATHRNQAQFAVKLLHPEISLHEDVRTRFLREGYVANSVKHAGAVRVVDDDVAEDGAAFLVMELLDGYTVEELAEKSGGVLSVETAVAVIDQLLDVLSAAHEKGIVHRDIKPANLFLTRDGVLKVLDFGIARARDAAATTSGHVTGTGMLLGTPAFMAPEQALAKSGEIDAQTDVWAAGATIFTLLTGRTVHEGDNGPQLLVAAATTQARSLGSVLPETPKVVVEAVDRALAFRKPERWLTAAEMRDGLRQAWKATAGEAPSRASLLPFFAEVEASADTVVPATAFAPTRPATPIQYATPAASPPARSMRAETPHATQKSWPSEAARSDLGRGGTTNQPVSSPASQEGIPALPVHRSPALTAFIVAAVVAAAAVGWKMLSASPRPADVAVPITASEPARVPTPVTSPIPQAVTPVASPTVVPAATEAPAAVVTSAKPTSTSKPSAAAKPSTSAAPKAPTGSPSPATSGAPGIPIQW